MNILAIESASTVCGTALFLENKMIDMDEITKLRVHGEHLPVIIDNILTNNSLIVSEQNGSLIKFGDLTGMADSVESLLNNSDKYERFSATAISMFDRYSNDNYSPNLMKVIKDRKLLLGIS